MKERVKKIVEIMKTLKGSWTIPQLFGALEANHDTVGLFTMSQLYGILYRLRIDKLGAGTEKILISPERNQFRLVEAAYYDILAKESTDELFKDVKTKAEVKAESVATLNKVVDNIEKVARVENAKAEADLKEVSLHEVTPEVDYYAMNRTELRSLLKSNGISRQTVITETNDRKAWDNTRVLRVYCKNLF